MQAAVPGAGRPVPGESFSKFLSRHRQLAAAGPAWIQLQFLLGLILKTGGK
tara:strand:+ start:100 stop:252 length:153 start_codon:yes stop_codon:yes gene_type:complete